MGTGTEVTAHIRHSKGKGVTLGGRWEGTTRVLHEDIADLVRLHFFAGFGHGAVDARAYV